MANVSYQIEVDDRELATILGALRIWQWMLESGTSARTPTMDPNRILMILGITTNGDTIVPLDASEIDELAQRINGG